MTDANAIAGTYADLRQVKSRGVWQLVIDVPAEYAERLVELFGLPRQDEPTHLAIARLNLNPEAVTVTPASKTEAAGGVTPTPRTQAPASGPKRQKALAEWAGIRCTEPAFQDWILARAVDAGWSIGKAPADCPGETREEVAASVVRKLCGVRSRAEIRHGTGAANIWRGIETSYMQATGQMAEAR